MVYERDDLLCLLVAQAEPDGQALSKVGPLTWPIFCNFLFTMPKLFPSVFLVQHTKGLAVFCTAALVGTVCVHESAIAHDLPRVLALLKSEDVMRPSTCKKLSLLTSFSTLFLVDLKPLK